jgi:hypothetical protein
MVADDAELSSIATALHELARRITGLAERHAHAEGDPLGQGLFDVERTLVEALRKLDRIRRGT